MTETPLHEHLELPGMTQQILAEAVGCHQTTISQMLRTKRPMFVVTHDDGQVELIDGKYTRRVRQQKPSPLISVGT